MKNLARIYIISDYQDSIQTNKQFLKKNKAQEEFLNILIRQDLRLKEGETMGSYYMIMEAIEEIEFEELKKFLIDNKTKIPIDENTNRFQFENILSKVSQKNCHTLFFQ